MAAVPAIEDGGPPSPSPAFITATLVVSGLALGLLGALAWDERESADAPAHVIAGTCWVLGAALIAYAALRRSRPGQARGVVAGALAATATYLVVGPWSCDVIYTIDRPSTGSTLFTNCPGGFIDWSSDLPAIVRVGAPIIASIAVAIAVSITVGRSASRRRPSPRLPERMPSVPVAAAGLVCGTSGYLILWARNAGPDEIVGPHWPLVVTGALIVLAGVLRLRPVWLRGSLVAASLVAPWWAWAPATDVDWRAPSAVDLVVAVVAVMLVLASVLATRERHPLASPSHPVVVTAVGTGPVVFTLVIAPDFEPENQGNVVALLALGVTAVVGALLIAASVTPPILPAATLVTLGLGAAVYVLLGSWSCFSPFTPSGVECGGFHVIRIQGGLAIAGLTTLGAIATTVAALRPHRTPVQ